MLVEWRGGSFVAERRTVNRDMLGSLYCRADTWPNFVYITLSGSFVAGEYKPWTKHGRNMDDPWINGSSRELPYLLPVVRIAQI